MTFFDANNMFNILGGAPSMLMSAAGAGAALAYYQASGASRNFYTNNFRASGRLFMGATLGLALGYKFFGDRQRLHNAYLAERLRRRYPDSIALNQTDLWKLKGIMAPHEFYQWK